MKICVPLLIAMSCMACGIAYKVPTLSRELQCKNESIDVGRRYPIAFTRDGNTRIADIIIESFRKTKLFTEVNYLDNMVAKDYFIVNVVSDKKVQWHMPCGEGNIFGLLPIICPIDFVSEFSITKAGVMDKYKVTYKAESKHANGWITMFLLPSRNWRYEYPLEEHYMNAACLIHQELYRYVK